MDSLVFKCRCAQVDILSAPAIVWFMALGFSLIDMALIPFNYDHSEFMLAFTNFCYAFEY